MQAATATAATALQEQLPAPASQAAPSQQQQRVGLMTTGRHKQKLPPRSSRTAELQLDTLGIEPRASRMLSGCDTTTPRAHEQLGWVRNHADHKRRADPDVRDACATLSRRGGAPAEPPSAACRPAAAEHTEVARWTSPGTAHNQDGQPAGAGSAGLPTARHIGVASSCPQWRCFSALPTTLLTNAGHAGD